MRLDPTTKKAALFSGLLHLSTLLFLVLAVVFTSLFAREEEPYIFEMVALPESVDTFQPESLEPVPDLALDLPEFEPIEIPQPEPEPVIETPPPPEPKPQPVTKPPPVVQAPPPVPVEKPKPELKPEPVKEEPKPKIISYDEFVKQHGKPEAPKVAPRPKPAPTPTRKIDTSKIEKSLRQSIMSVPELSLTTQSTTADTDAMKRWRSILAAALDREWKKSKTEGTAGKSVRVSFFVSAGGAISSVKIVESSGLSDLDAIGIGTVRSLGSFQPPPTERGEIVTVLLKVE